MIRAPDGTAYALHGRLDAPLVVLIHGLGLTHEVWDQMVPALAPQFCVLTYDMLGHGQTPSRPNPDLAALAAQLAALLDHLGRDKAALVGFSLGGMIARRFAQDYPARTQALAILHSPHRRSDAAQAAIVARVMQADSQGPSATVEAALQRWFTDDFRAQNPAMMNKVRGWVLGNNPATYPDYYRILATGIGEIVAPNPPIACPTLVVTGDEDYGNGPEMTFAIAAEIVGAQTLILRGLRHMALMQAPDLTNAPLLAFLTKVTHD
jgi:pimeloyl-ACP methyl ester carboxylesterase